MRTRHLLLASIPAAITLASARTVWLAFRTGEIHEPWMTASMVVLLLAGGVCLYLVPLLAVMWIVEGRRR